MALVTVGDRSGYCDKGDAGGGYVVECFVDAPVSVGDGM